jgi:non-specific serine/threonine protein kinase
MDSSSGGTAPSGDKNRASFPGFLQKLRKRRIIETLAAFIGGGWLLVEVVERLLVGHYKFPEETIDLTVVSVIGALLATLVWRWFRSTEKRPGNVKIEVLLVPLIILATVAIDLNLVLQIAGLPGKTLLIGIAALCLGIVWVILKLSQWASAMPESRKKEIEVSELSAVRPEKSIVVLPFTDLSPQKDQDYFCDGMTEEIITDLSRVRDLLVISRNSAMTFRGTQKKTGEIAKEVKVRYVLEGSVRKAGNDLRITAQMIDAMNDSHIWAEKYTGTLDDVFDIQEKVSRSIVNALKVKLEPEESRRMSERLIDNLAAYDCYLKAYAEILEMTEDGLNRGVRHLQNGLDIMGENALLYSGLAFAHLQLVNIGAKHEEDLEKAEEFGNKALAIDPEFARAHAVLGWIAMWKNPRQVIHHFKSALSISPDDSFSLQGLACCYIQLKGSIAAAIPVCEKLVRVDPLNMTTQWLQGGIHFYSGEYGHALPPWRRLYDLYPDNPIAQFYYAMTLAYLGQMDQAFPIIDRSASSTPENAFTKQGLMLKYAILKDKGDVFREMTPEFQKTCQRDCTFAHHLAGIYALLGDTKEALDWLDTAVNRGFINYPLLAEKELFLANIRGEERFKKLLERVKYEWEHFKE